MKSSISIFFEVPERVYKVLEMVAEQNNKMDLYCMGGNEILLAGSLSEVEDDLEDENKDWEDIEDFEDDSWWNKDLPF